MLNLCSNVESFKDSIKCKNDLSVKIDENILNQINNFESIKSKKNYKSIETNSKKKFFRYSKNNCVEFENPDFQNLSRKQKLNHHKIIISKLRSNLSNSNENDMA